MYCTVQYIHTINTNTIHKCKAREYRALHISYQPSRLHLQKHLFIFEVKTNNSIRRYTRRLGSVATYAILDSPVWPLLSRSKLKPRLHFPLRDSLKTLRLSYPRPVRCGRVSDHQAGWQTRQFYQMPTFIPPKTRGPHTTLCHHVTIPTIPG